MLLSDPSLFGQMIEVQFALDDDIDSFLGVFIDRNTPKLDRRINDTMIGFEDILNEVGLFSCRLSDYLFFSSACRNAKMIAIKGAFIRSIITLSIFLLIGCPLCVTASIYL